MAFVNEIKAKCCRCMQDSDIRCYGSINVSEEPELKEQVKDGSLFIWECPHCGTHNLLKTETLYHDPEKKLMVWLLPSERLDEVQSAKLNAIADSLGDYTLRRVEDVGSLIEKVNIIDAGLDDVVLEMCKYVTRMELCEKHSDKEEAIMDAPFKFYRMQGADNEIVLSFPLDGNMQGINIGFNVYEDCRGILQRNKAALDSIEGFACIDSKWLAGFFR